MAVQFEVRLDDEISAPAKAAAGSVDALLASFDALSGSTAVVDDALGKLPQVADSVSTSIKGVKDTLQALDAQSEATAKALEGIERELLAVTLAEKRAQRSGAGEGILRELSEKRKSLGLDKEILQLSAKRLKDTKQQAVAQKGVTEAGSGMPTLLGQITTAALSAAKAVAQIGLGFARSVVQTATLKSDAIRSMEALVGNRDAAKSFVAELTSFRGADSFDAQALLDAGRSLVGGGFSESQASVLIRGMASAASVGGNDSAMLGQLAASFGEVRAKQALDMGKLIEISKASKFAIKVDDVVAAIGAQSGQTAEEVRSALAKAQVGSEEGLAGIMQAIKSGIGKGDVGGGAAAGAGTLGGLMAQIEKKFFNLVKPVEDSPGMMKMQGALKGVVDLLDTGSERGKRLQAAFDGLINSGFGALVGGGGGDGTSATIDRIIAAVEALAAVVGPVIASIRTFGEGLFEGLGDVLTPLFDMIRDLQDLEPGSLDLIIQSFKDLGKVVGWVAGFFALGVATIVTVTAAKVSGVTYLIRSIPDAFWWVVDQVGGAFSAIGRFFASLWGMGSNLVDGLWGGIKAGWGRMLLGFESLVSLLPDSVRRVLGIASPAKVMVPLGVHVTEGLGEGFERGAPAMQRQLEGTVTPLAAMSVPPLGAGASGRGGAVTINITINADGASREAAESIAERVRAVVAQLLTEAAMTAGAA